MTLGNLNLSRTAGQTPLAKNKISHIFLLTGFCLESIANSSSEEEDSAGREQHSGAVGEVFRNSGGAPAAPETKEAGQETRGKAK